VLLPTIECLQKIFKYEANLVVTHRKLWLKWKNEFFLDDCMTSFKEDVMDMKS